MMIMHLSCKNYSSILKDGWHTWLRLTQLKYSTYSNLSWHSTPPPPTSSYWIHPCERLQTERIRTQWEQNFSEEIKHWWSVRAEKMKLTRTRNSSKQLMYSILRKIHTLIYAEGKQTLKRILYNNNRINSCMYTPYFVLHYLPFFSKKTAFWVQRLLKVKVYNPTIICQYSLCEGTGILTRKNQRSHNEIKFPYQLVPIGGGWLGMKQQL